MNADRLVAPLLGRVSVGGQEPPLCLPPSLPLCPGQFDVDTVKVVPEPSQPLAASAYRYSSRIQSTFDLGQLGL